MKLLEFIWSNWGVIVGAIAGLAAWHKDFIMRKLNLRKGHAEAYTAEKEIDTVYIENSEKLVNIYGKSMDDLLKRNEAMIDQIRAEHDRNVKHIEERYDRERKKDAEKDKQREDLLTKTIESEKVLSKTVENLKNEVKKLTTEVKKLTTQLNYYRKHSDIQLPKELE